MPIQIPEYLSKNHKNWNRVSIEARLSTDVEIKEFPAGTVGFSSFRFRGSRRTGSGGFERFRSVKIAVMFVGRAAAMAAGGVKGQICKAEGRMVSLELYGPGGRRTLMPRLIADSVELGPVYALPKKPLPDPLQEIPDGATEHAEIVAETPVEEFDV